MTNSRLAEIRKTPNAPLCDQSSRKETAMTEVDSTFDPFVRSGGQGTITQRSFEKWLRLELSFVLC